MELTVQNVYGLLLRSKLLPLEEARAMFARWQEEARDQASNLARFAAWMVGNKYLTEYQASLLARGHADNFFINEYKILDRLGKGRMAGVYKGQHGTGQVVAIKVLPPSRARDAQMLSRFQREARLALRLKHPNIVRAFQTGVANGLHYLVMEYLEGETVEEMQARRGKLLPGEAVRIIYQTLQGLQHIHAQGLVHRDLKPSNLMLVNPPGVSTENTLRATVKILDIGLGRALFEDVGEQLAEAGLTGEGVLLGTPDYMAPEQARDAHTSDIRGDIYSLGCVLYHLLAGQPPFPDTNIISQMIRHATETPRPVKELNPTVPDGLQQILGWMLAKDPTKRYPTPERASQALQVFLAAGSVPAANPEADPRMRSYLTWLEVENRKPLAAGVPSTPPALPAAVPAVPMASPVAAGAHAAPVAAAPVAAPPSPPPAAAVALPPTVIVPITPGKAAPPVPPPVPGDARNRDGKAKRSRADKRRARKERRSANHALPPVPPSANAAALNVELVPLNLPPEPDVSKRWLRLTRRDILVFIIGAAAGWLATFLGLVLAEAGKK